MVRRWEGALACGAGTGYCPRAMPRKRAKPKRPPPTPSGEVDFNGPGTPPRPAEFAQGSDEAIAAYQQRVENREALFSPADRFVPRLDPRDAAAPAPAAPRLYFVWRANVARPYRVYTTRLHALPAEGDLRCLWRGANYAVAVRVARLENRKRRRN